MALEQTPEFLASLPSVDRVLRSREAEPLIAEFGRPAVTAVIREVLSNLRANGDSRSPGEPVNEGSIVERVGYQLQLEAQPPLRTVFNLTGTVLHTNLGRAPLPDQAIEAASMAARAPCNLEYDG
jgi:L-seryl-tRNA(Ser) seleniumtransferase